MQQTATRFARRIILAHGLVLVVALVVVALAVRQIYSTAREQVVQQAEDRQQLLANQTATAIQNYYKSIQDDLDLIYRAEQEQASVAGSTTSPTSQPVLSLQEKRTDDSVVKNQPFIRRVIWKQLQSRVSLMFSYERGIPRRFEIRPGQPRPDARTNARPEGRPDTKLDFRAGARPELRFPRPDFRSDRSSDNRPEPGPEAGKPDTGTAVTPAKPGMHAYVVGSSDPTLKIDEIVSRSQDWLSNVTGPSSISEFQLYNGRGFNVIGVPMHGDTLAAVVPIAGVEKQYLGHLNDDPDVATGAWLIDDQSTAMAASQAKFVGSSINAISDPQVREMANDFIARHGIGTQVIPRSFKFGTYAFGPTMISAAPVSVANTTWELFIATPMSDVDGFVAKLLHGSVFWSAIVIVAVTGILTSTAIQMIRSRMRMERQRHDALTRELSQARDIQLAWLPDKHLLSSAVNVAAVNSPASHISGDFYNWFELPDGRLVVVIGDVTGHGMSAAFLMATTQLLVRNTMTRVSDPGQCLEEVNRQLCVQVFNGQFVTMLIMIVDFNAGQLHLATAGHPSPLVSDGESFCPLKVEPQLVLGVDRDALYPTETFALGPTASLLLYTDGVVECPDHCDSRFGNDRLRRSLYGRYDRAQDMLDRVISAVDEFRGKRVLDDDLTIVAVQLQPAGSARDLLAVAQI